MSVTHYENFPVASWLCPPALRPAVKALYWFARTADDIADEGDATPAQRLADLTAYRAALDHALFDRVDPRARWREVFEPLRLVQQRHHLSARLLHDLLDAFEQDIHNPAYLDRGQLLDYCRRSANPVGRLLLELHGIDAPEALRESDAICTALQLINFWQDLGVDLRRNRCYVPAADLQHHGIQRLQAGDDTPAARALVQDLCIWSQQMMLSGAPLVHRLPGRVGWELRLVVQGGLRILEKIRRMHHATLSQRPRLDGWDAVPMLLRAAAMRRPHRVPA